MNHSIAALRQRRKALIQRIKRADFALVRGSLIERYKRCGNPNCKCADGKGHGPKYYLSVSQPGSRPEMDYVPQDLQADVATYLANFQALRQILEELCEINRGLLRQREPL
ncbi:MAG: DUF6788 family protein [Planctomycetota bacterium]